MRGILVAGNWKLNGSRAEISSLLDGILAGYEPTEGVEVLVCPPYPYLAAVGARIEGTSIRLGAQDVSEHFSGAYTGEVSATMLLDVGCQYVIVGHSERRALFGDSNGVVAEKFAAAAHAGLTPILCIGETLEERESGNTRQVVDGQLRAVLDDCGIAALAQAVIAYEPVWAIGTGRTATPEQAQEVHGHIRQVLAEADAKSAAEVRILYGGSVKGSNAGGLFCQPDIDGGLIGGASLDAGEFLRIAEAAGTTEKT